MARLFTDGAEMRDTLFWTYAGASITVTSADPVPAFSSYAYRLNGEAYKLIGAISECYVRERVWFNSTAGGYYYYWRYPAFRDGTTDLAWLEFSATGRVVARTPSGILATSANPLNSSQWYLLEVYFKLGDNPDGRFVVYVDGTEYINFTGDTKYSSSYSTFNYVAWKNAGGTSYLGLDDLALNDTTGGVDDTYCGDGVIIKVTPDANGAHNNWHGSDLDDVDNYLLVDDFPNDGDTTYVYHDGSSSGTQDQYGLSDYDGTDKTILRIYPEARLRKTSAAAHTVKLGTLASGGTDAMSAAMNLTTAYARFVGDEQTVNPVDSGAWEEADIDALQFVVEVG